MRNVDPAAILHSTVIQEMLMFRDSKTHVTLPQNPALERICHRLNLLSNVKSNKSLHLVAFLASL